MTDEARLQQAIDACVMDLRKMAVTVQLLGTDLGAVIDGLANQVDARRRVLGEVERQRIMDSGETLFKANRAFLAALTGAADALKRAQET